MIFRFLKHASQLTGRLGPLFALLFGFIVIGALLISQVEDLSVGDALYFAFITGLTIGYGDIVPHTAIGRFIAVLLGLVGILFTGLVVAVAVRRVREAMGDEDRARQNQ